MQYKDILIHLDDSEATQDRINLGIAICQKYNAHATGFFVAQPWHPPALAMNSSFSSAMVTEGEAEVSWLEHEQREHQKHQDAIAENLSMQFHEIAKEYGVSAHFKTANGDLRELLAKESHYHDLTILAYKSNSDEDSFAHLSSLSADVAIKSGAPVLMVPDTLESEELAHLELGYPRKPLVAWNASAESSRALRDAIPFLKSSNDVALFFNNNDDKYRNSQNEKDRLKNYVIKHDIDFNFIDNHNSASSTGNLLLELAKTENRDLIVMGAFGHSRIKELLLGGTTRFVLRNTPVPVLISH